MATMRYQPWAVVSQLQDEINRVFGNPNDEESSSATAEWCRLWTCVNSQTALSCWSTCRESTLRASRSRSTTVC